MSEATYYQRNREVMLNRANEYYQNNREVLREKPRKKYRVLSEDKKNIKRNYGRNWYQNMSEIKEQRLKEYQKIIAILKNQNNFFYLCCIKIQKELIFNNGHNNYNVSKYYFQKDKKIH